jgi:hypothetical protein
MSSIASDFSSWDASDWLHSMDSIECSQSEASQEEKSLAIELITNTRFITLGENLSRQETTGREVAALADWSHVQELTACTAACLGESTRLVGFDRMQPIRSVPRGEIACY